MRAWLESVTADIATLRASWSSVRGGWSAARHDARELVAHRRVLVDTSAMTRDGMQVVLRTRLRLIGDTQTDVLRGWLDAATPNELVHVVQAHQQSVAAATGGWAAARGMERLLVFATSFAGAIWSLAMATWTLVTTPVAHLLQAILADWWLWGGVAFGLLGIAVRWTVRLTLRSVFRRALPGGR